MRWRSSSVCHEVGAEASFYAHASAGCLHINPIINLKTQEGLAQMRSISEAVARLAIAHGGTTTGEHGEGLARSYFNEQLFGPRLHQAFRELKGLFDPDNIQNPGKIVNAPAPWEPGLLRLGPEYRTPHAPKRTHLNFSLDGGFSGMVEMCNGQGVCRKHDAGVMCPSFMATRDEAASTRGYANALRSALSGELGTQGLASSELHAALDLCLECKGCKRECPSTVDMAKLKYEFLSQYQSVHGVPLPQPTLWTPQPDQSAWQSYSTPGELDHAQPHRTRDARFDGRHRPAQTTATDRRPELSSLVQTSPNPT